MNLEETIARLNGWVKAIDITVSNQNRFEWPELRSLQGTLESTVKLLERFEWVSVDEHLPEIDRAILTVDKFGNYDSWIYSGEPTDLINLSWMYPPPPRS